MIRWMLRACLLLLLLGAWELWRMISYSPSKEFADVFSKAWNEGMIASGLFDD